MLSELVLLLQVFYMIWTDRSARIFQKIQRILSACVCLIFEELLLFIKSSFPKIVVGEVMHCLN